MEIYVTDLAAYNEGNLVGEWVNIEGEDADSIRDLISDLLEEWSEEAGEKREEYFISDYNDCPISLGEYESIERIAEVQEAIEKHGEAIIEAANSCGVDFDSIDDALIGEYASEEDFADELFGELYMHDVPESVRYYINYAAFARDIFIDGYMMSGDYVFSRDW